MGRGIISFVGMICVSLYGLYRIVMLFSRDPAFAYGAKGIQVGRLFKLYDYPWNEVRDLRLTHWTRPRIPYVPFVNSLLRFLPAERDYLELELSSSRCLKLRPDMMELPSGGEKELIEAFRATQVAALGERGAAMARLVPKSSELSTAPASALQAERWQRLGIGSDANDEASAEVLTAAPVQPVLPPRPSFGRKVG